MLRRPASLAPATLPQPFTLRDGRQAVIRRIRREDNPQVAKIIRTVMPEFGAVGPNYSISDPEVDAMFEAYQEPQSAFLVIEHEKRLLGVGGLAPLDHGEPGQCEIKKMYFLRDVRGQGIGKHLFSLLLEMAKDMGFTLAYVETLTQMHAANALYRNFGMKPLAAPLGNTGHCGCDTWYAMKL